jgi:hypothetical protein
VVVDARQLRQELVETLFHNKDLGVVMVFLVKQVELVAAELVRQAQQ